MELKKITLKTFDEFNSSLNTAHFLQSSGWASVAKSRGYIPHVLGLFDDDVLKGTALLVQRPILYYSTFYSPRGFNVDFNDHKLIAEMTKELKKYVKAHRGLYLKIDPSLIIRKRDPQDAETKEEFIENIKLIDVFKKLGFSHRGFTNRFSESSMPRFTFRVDITKDVDKLKADMHATTRQILNGNNPYHVKICKNDFADFKAFYRTMEDTAKRKHIYLEPLSFYETFYEGLRKEGMADLFSAKVDLLEVIEIYKKEIEENQEKIAKLLENPNRKTANKVKEIENHLTKMQKNLKELEDIPADTIVLSAIITAKFADKVWLVHGGNRDILKFLNANYLLYYAIMLDSKEEGYAICDFYGTEGKIDKHSDLYGLYLFKARFGGDLCEFIGEFDLVVRPFANKIITTLLKLRRKLILKKAIGK